MTKIILIRHGETVWNREMKYQGHADIELTAAGMEQARLLAQSLAKEKIHAVYASDLCRAVNTAEQVAGKHNLPVQSMPEFREINFGEWEGLTYEKINKQSSSSMEKLFSHPDEVVIPGGETFREVKERAMEALGKLVTLHGDENIAVVSHGGTIRTILCAVLNVHLNHLWQIHQHNTAVNILEFHDGKAFVALVNDTHHLRAL
jgi:alpha-ribazole phosphatase